MVPRELITEILMVTKASVRFRRALSEKFKIKTDQTEYRLSLMLFSTTLDKVIRQQRATNEIGLPNT